jgi:hypothetical protein
MILQKGLREWVDLVTVCAPNWSICKLISAERVRFSCCLPGETGVETPRGLDSTKGLEFEDVKGGSSSGSPRRGVAATE